MTIMINGVIGVFKITKFSCIFRIFIYDKKIA